MGVPSPTRRIRLSRSICWRAATIFWLDELVVVVVADAAAAVVAKATAATMCLEEDVGIQCDEDQMLRQRRAKMQSDIFFSLFFGCYLGRGPFPFVWPYE